MDIILIIIGISLLLAGFVGCVLPVLPGPPLSFLALLMLQITRWGDFSSSFLWFSALAAIVVTILDYVVPVWGTTRFGGTRAGIWGASIGLVVGLFFGLSGLCWALLPVPLLANWREMLIREMHFVLPWELFLV